MKFKNETEDGQQLRSVIGKRYQWDSVKPGDTVDVPKEVGLKYGWTPVAALSKNTTVGKDTTETEAEESSIGTVKVETKQKKKKK